MANTLSNDPIIELKIKVPVNVIRVHFSTAIESSVGEWFSWDDVVIDINGNPVQATLTYWEDGEEDDEKTIVFTDRMFAEGLQQYVTVKGSQTTEVQYLGEGDWDIDALGADCIVQYMVYGDIILS